ncbi:MAG TPA: hypothetical protein VKC56_03235 [Gallionellaceae bacterium]|nr:hypothetical protein [Gallionellaceae bacterium]
MEFARHLCARARSNVEYLVQGLSQAGYVFAFPDEVHVPDDGQASEWISEFERLGVYLPIFLQAWITEVGSVNLMGSHPGWPESGYADLPPREADIWYADPLVLQLDREYLKSEYDDWRWFVEEDGPAEAGPFQLSIAPDYVHKANISGGPAYSIDTTVPAVDTLLLNARDCTSLFYHVHNAFLWGGFPGFAYLEAALPEPAASIRANLLPL